MHQEPLSNVYSRARRPGLRFRDTEQDLPGRGQMDAHYGRLRKVSDFLAKIGCSQAQNTLSKRPPVPGRLRAAAPVSLAPCPPSHLTLGAAGDQPESLAEAAGTARWRPHYLLCLGDESLLSLTAIKCERLKYCRRREAKYLPMCLQVLSVRWALVNTGTIWAPNSCAQNVGFPIQIGFPATIQRGYLRGRGNPMAFPPTFQPRGLSLDRVGAPSGVRTP